MSKSMPTVPAPEGFAVGKPVTLVLPPCPVSTPEGRRVIPAKRITVTPTRFARNTYFNQFPKGAVMIQYGINLYYPLSYVAGACRKKAKAGNTRPYAYSKGNFDVVADCYDEDGPDYGKTMTLHRRISRESAERSVEQHLHDRNRFFVRQRTCFTNFRVVPTRG